MHQITLILTQNNSEVDFVLKNALEKRSKVCIYHWW